MKEAQGRAHAAGTGQKYSWRYPPPWLASKRSHGAGLAPPAAVAPVTANDTRGFWCCCTSAVSRDAGEESGGAPVTGDAGEAKGGDAGEISGDTPVIDVRWPLLLRHGRRSGKRQGGGGKTIHESKAATSGTIPCTLAALPVAGMSHWHPPSWQTTVARRSKRLSYP